MLKDDSGLEPLLIPPSFPLASAVTIAESGGDLSVERMLEQVAAKENKYSMAIGCNSTRASNSDEIPADGRIPTLTLEQSMS